MENVHETRFHSLSLVSLLKFLTLIPLSTIEVGREGSENFKHNGLLLEVLAGIAMSTKVGSLLESTIPHCKNMKLETSLYLENVGLDVKLMLLCTVYVC